MVIEPQSDKSGGVNGGEGIFVLMLVSLLASLDEVEGGDGMLTLITLFASASLPLLSIGRGLKLHAFGLVAARFKILYVNSLTTFL